MPSGYSIAWRMLLIGALSLSIGWGIRGNFGHEYGAMIPGALAAIAVVLVSGREDWWRRIAYFAMFGALGWSFGGSISYMQVIAYTHSGHAPSQLYGFACLAVIGFLWGVLGGAGTALPACVDRERLTSLFPPTLAVFFAWFLQDLLVPYIARAYPASQRHRSILYWYDTDWIAALTALVAVLILGLIRRRLCWGSRLALYLAVGWWVGFLTMVGLVDGLGINVRMTPPRGDNWAGILGMTGGLFLFCWRERLAGVAYAALLTGLVGGFGFAAATFLKLVEVKYVPLALSHLFGESAWQTNWHSILEQTYGFLNGLGVAAAMYYLARRLPPVTDEPRLRPWTEIAAVFFVLIAITYVNIVKNVRHWVDIHALPPALYGVSSRVWFDIAYGLLAAAVVFLLVQHFRVRLALVPETPLGQGQLLYLVFLWWIVLGNLLRALPPFAEQRLITEGVIHANAVLCSVLILMWPRPMKWPLAQAHGITARSFATLIGLGVVGLALTVYLFLEGARRMHGDQFIGYGGYHTRFGPNAQPGKPDKGKEHP